MPEMPEMENYRKLISDQILNIPITNVIVNREKSINIEGDNFISELLNTRIIFIERRGKYLNFHLNNGRRLLVHLMLGGLVYVGTDGDLPHRNTQVEISFGATTLYFIGLRLGYVHLLSAKEVEQVLGQLGPEMTDRRMDINRFFNIVNGRRGSLKTLLVNQNVIAGIGNRYADEIAFEAGLLPSAKVQDLGPEVIERLFMSTKSVLSKAVDAGGYIDMPVTKDDSHTGSYKSEFKVYDREGELCPQCGGIVVKAELNSKKTFYCPTCQHEQ
ncbi:Fpg/Nei family DNA glycosylase [Paenibacillus glacialis]|uniref:Formamidopyrimidine-DNA glycosylase n=1 Tax=Paenibacillus glacialis TaxID=494026 RepID=A0A168MD22_9BACL|nr:DNA-formamidopyrimidine glycosylase family protein [Paenibacillus glacialis]OAB44529.1 formamidopyrimidine-DNA glycosylase [Paenibacillus glacialis]